LFNYRHLVLAIVAIGAVLAIVAIGAVLTIVAILAIVAILTSFVGHLY
jgi:uncharacterized membrane protein